MQHFDLTVQCWACNRWTQGTNSTSSSPEATCTSLAEGQWLAHADEAPYTITSSWDLFCCLPCRGAQNKDWIVMTYGRMWMTMKDSVQKNLSQRSVYFTTHTLCIQEMWFCCLFQRSTINVWMHTSLCFSFSNLIPWSLLVWNTIEPHKCFKNMTLHFSADELFALFCLSLLVLLLVPFLVVGNTTS